MHEHYTPPTVSPFSYLTLSYSIFCYCSSASFSIHSFSLSFSSLLLSLSLRCRSRGRAALEDDEAVEEAESAEPAASQEIGWSPPLLHFRLSALSVALPAVCSFSLSPPPFLFSHLKGFSCGSLLKHGYGRVLEEQ